MKRRTRDKVGNWPNMKDDTLRAVCDELIRARQKHPSKIGMGLFEVVAQALKSELVEHDAGRMSAQQVYARAAQVAALAIRVLEEGALGYKYADYAPPFKLEREHDGDAR